MTIEPVGSNILIEQTEAVTQTASGLDLPQEMQGMNNEAIILAVNKNSEFSKGQKILFNPHAGVEVSGGKIISEGDIIAILHQPALKMVKG